MGKTRWSLKMCAKYKEIIRDLYLLQSKSKRKRTGAKVGDSNAVNEAWGSSGPKQNEIVAPRLIKMKVWIQMNCTT